MTRRQPATPIPLWYKDAIIYQAHVRAFFDSTNDGIGDFPGLTAEARLPAGARRQLRSGSSRSTRRRCATTGTTSPTTRTSIRATARSTTSTASSRQAHGRAHPRHHRAGHQPHLRPAPVVPGGAARPGRIARTRLLRLERHEPEVPGRPHHLHRHRDVELELGRHREGVLLAPLLPPPAGPELRQPGGARGGDPGDAVLARSRRRRPAARRRAVPDRARGHHLREPARDARHPEEIRAALDARYPDRMLLAEANQWPADVRPYFGDGDECHMAFHFPLMPRMFMARAGRRTATRSSRSSGRRPTFPRTASGRCSSATTTS